MQVIEFVKRNALWFLIGAAALCLILLIAGGVDWSAATPE